MGVSIEVFQPSSEDVYNPSVTTTAAATQINFNGVKRRLRFASPTGSGDYWMKFGDSTVVASATNGTLILGGTAEIFTCPAKSTHVSLLAATSTVAVNIRPGAGS